MKAAAEHRAIMARHKTNALHKTAVAEEFGVTESPVTINEAIKDWRSNSMIDREETANLLQNGCIELLQKR
jgi:hypothetical protein